MKNLVRSIVAVISLVVMMSVSAFAQTNLEAEALAKVNQIRLANGLSEVKYSASLEGASTVRVGEITQKFSHQRLDGSDFYTVDANNVWGENLAKGYNSADEVVDAWMASPSHRANILSANYNTCAISTTTKDGKTYWAQEFGI
ncbi:CAP domain-containing protein [Oribacterium sp. P6A1]|uniref:CAP domain-containing protein n=1 Tax=Oribacterium sp. P6A1 TaxID=1410612 RepID=UPI00055F7359|nr:CAP domain-containing protein [Oribacterium sp. P6A1]